MNFYEVNHEGDVRVVQSPTMREAIAAWAQAMCRQYGPTEHSGWTLADEPESIRLLSTGDLISAEPSR